MTVSRKLHVFLCHASLDKPIVRELYQRLLAEDWIDPWLDEEKLLPGQDWDMEIENAVEAADVVVVCLSNTSVSKEGYVQRELKFVLDIALEKPEGTIFIIPLRLDDCDLPRHLRAWQYVDYFPADRRDWAIQRLMKSLKIRHEDLKPKNVNQKDQYKGKLAPVESKREEVGPVPVENRMKSEAADVPEKKVSLNQLLELLKAKGVRRVEIGGTFPLVAYFLLASLQILGPDDDAVKMLLAASSVLAGIFFLVRKTIPETVIFRILGVIYLLLYGLVNYSDYYGLEIPFISIISGIIGISVGVVLLVSIQRPKKPIYYSSFSFALFLFLMAAKMYAYYVGDYEAGYEIPVMVTSVITSFFLWRDL
jgi:hypothetical protein